VLFKREFSNEVAKTMTMVIDLGIDLLITIFILVISTGLSLYFVAERLFLLGKCDFAVAPLSFSQPGNA
jgi:hypothetical protein